ncbi:MAG: hypothetical protein WCW04_03425, partial [Candidatus Paceibacterota bacterium]
MEKIKNLKFHRFAFLPAIFLVFVLLFTTHVFAASTPVKTPGEIIDATCPNGNVGCIMKTSISLTLKEVSVSVNNKIIILLQNLSSTSSALSSGWSTFTNELLDNSENALSAHKQFADNLSNNLTRGTLAYTNTVLNIPDQTTKVLSSTKDLGLATTASVGDSLLGASNGISDGWVSFTDTILNNTKQSLTNTKDLAVSIWNNITSIPNTLKNGAETFIATLKGPAPTTPQVVLPPSLVTTTATPPSPTHSESTDSSVSTTGSGPSVSRPTAITNITQQQRSIYINQYDPSILPRLQGVELALLNNINHNTNQTDRVYDSIIKS